MSKTAPETEKGLEPDVRPASRFNKVWIIPIIALLLGLWLVKRSYDEKGETIIVRFETADGLQEGKTEVKCRNVTIGMVEDINLTDDLEVDITIRVKPAHLHLIRTDSRIWVEKPRVQGASISGLGTLISGAFLQLDPGIGEEGQRYFDGLETPPLTPRTIEGLRLTLNAEEPGSIGIGSGIYYNQNPIGRVESRTFNMDTKTVNFGVFIEKEFSDLITDNTLFWQASGISLHIGADGFDLELPSLDSLVAGRIAVGVPLGVSPGKPVPDDSLLALFKSAEIARNTTFEGGVEFLLLLDESLRGLKVGSPVEFRGLRVGRVGKISYNLIEEVNIAKIPVLIQLDTRLLATHFPPSILDEGEGGFENALKQGLRASLKSSNLLTGQLYVDLDYYPEALFTGIQQRGDLIVLPTVHTGLESLQDKVAALLDKFNDLQLEELVTKVGQTSDEATQALSNVNLAMVSSKGVVADAQTTLKEISEAVKSLNTILIADDTQAISGDLRDTLASVNKSLEPLSNNGAVYGDLRRTMDELRSAIRSMERMTTEIADKPNSLLFGKTPNSKKIPRARR
ncbi:MAG: paraquat-inducible protein B [Akkermansiaceae bacterium]|jgi:paraquat-inducible protein B